LDDGEVTSFNPEVRNFLSCLSIRNCETMGSIKPNMRRTKEIRLTLVTAFGMTFTSACNSPYREVRNCVDAQGMIVRDQFCDQPESSYAWSYHYHFIYGGSSGGHFGDTVFGGSSTPSARATVFSGETGGIVRGGFGRGFFGGSGDGGGGE
jgi:hypothetical protein